MTDQFKNYLSNSRLIRKTHSFQEDYPYLNTFKDQVKMLDPNFDVVQIYSSNIFPELVDYDNKYFIVVDTHLHDIINRFYTNIVVSTRLIKKGQSKIIDQINNVFKANAYTFLSWSMYNDDYCSYHAAKKGKIIDSVIQSKIHKIDQFNLEIFYKFSNFYLFYHEYNHLAIKVDIEHLNISKNNLNTLIKKAKFVLSELDKKSSFINRFPSEVIEFIENKEAIDYLNAILSDNKSHEFEEIMCDVNSAITTFDILNQSKEPEMDEILYTIVTSQLHMFTSIVQLLEPCSMEYLKFGKELGLNLMEKMGLADDNKIKIRQNVSYLLSLLGITFKLYPNLDLESFVINKSRVKETTDAYQDVFTKHVMYATQEIFSTEEMIKFFDETLLLKKENKNKLYDYDSMRNAIFDWNQ